MKEGVLHRMHTIVVRTRRIKLHGVQYAPGSGLHAMRAYPALVVIETPAGLLGELPRFSLSPVTLVSPLVNSLYADDYLESANTDDLRRS